ncbi:MAG: BON domain-containing protein [Sulfuricaulis sp.]|uniref:BON domain-containing protein n=1 Tax=Sulfuricaulis sp. TaxID=2003553 RepID=UPI0025F3310E|nr:BON domain-containing protein [Sulfuricaulis sp.]MCR4346581.1 BON domain-containing protein [Sulfuricaulis sp.]
MNKPVLAAVCLMFATFIAQAEDQSATDISTARERSAPDNTNINKRDVNGQTLTPLDQSNSEADINITQSIRKSIMRENFSRDAKNIKIITQNGDVTLRGPVDSSAESVRIAELAKAVPGLKTLNNQLEVK